MSIVNISFSTEYQVRLKTLTNNSLEHAIFESGCADQYHDDILIELELLALLGAKDDMLAFANDYKQELAQTFYNEDTNDLVVELDKTIDRLRNL